MKTLLCSVFQYLSSTLRSILSSSTIQAKDLVKKLAGSVLRCSKTIEGIYAMYLDSTISTRHLWSRGYDSRLGLSKDIKCERSQVRVLASALSFAFRTANGRLLMFRSLGGPSLAKDADSDLPTQGHGCLLARDSLKMLFELFFFHRVEDHVCGRAEVMRSWLSLAWDSS